MDYTALSKAVRSWLLRRPRHRSPRTGQSYRTAFPVEVSSIEPRVLLSASVPGDDLWQPLEAFPTDVTAQAVSYLNLSDYTAFTMDEIAVRQTLDAAPDAGADFSINTSTITLLDPEGNPERFAIYESQIMAPELAAQFPNIKTYAGQGIDDPTAVVHLDLTPQGFHAQVLSEGGRWFIDPYYHLNDDYYASYYASAARPSESTGEALRGGVNDLDGDADANHRHGDGICCTECRIPAATARVAPSEAAETASRSGSVLRTYRAAIAATGEYTAFHGGTVELAQAAMVTGMNRVSGLYTTEFSIAFQLVGNNASLIYTDSQTDPYTNEDVGLMSAENQPIVDQIIGDANYDIGHVFGTVGGGIAGFGVVGQTGSKAGAATGWPNPVGDPFFVDYVCHEFGHQFRARHTFNLGNANRDPLAAYEPGSGSTIMSYAGLFGAQNNLQATNDPYFHSISFDEIISYVDNTIPNVGTRTNTGNSVPTINAGSDYTIPANTPFKLTAVGSDANGNGSLVYNWEERDRGPAQGLNAEQNTTSPIFRSWTPTSDPTRTFPRLEDILDGTLVKGEKLPSLTRTMNFRAIVRDNNPNGGGVNTDDMVVNVVDTGAPFAITSPNTNLAWTGGTFETVTWNVAGTTGNGINVANVRILLSTDGGNNFNTVLASSTPNDGSQSILVPLLTTALARIKVEAIGNVFFDISDANHSITGTNTAPVLAGAIANQNVNDNATISPFPSLTVTDPDLQALSVLVRIGSGTVRGEFTPASSSGWTRTVVGNDIQYARTFSAAANIGSVAQAAVRALAFQPRSNAIKPGTSEVTAFTVLASDGLSAPVSNNLTSVRTTSINDASSISGASPNVIVNDNATVNPFSTLTVSDADMQEMLISVTILNGKFRGDFTNANVGTGWTVRYTTGNDITYKRYFSPGPNVGATAQAAFRALVFQPRSNAIRPGTTEATDFQVTVSDGVSPAVANTGTRVTTTSVNNAPSIAGAVANQSMADNQTRSVFSTVTITDPDTQEMLARVTIGNGVNRGDFTLASTAGWTRTLSGSNIVYTRYFNPAANIGAQVQSAIRALVFQPRSNVPIGTTETTSFTVFVNDGIVNTTNGASSVNTTGVAPRPAAPSPIAPPTFLDSDITTVVLSSVNKSRSNPLTRLLRKSR